ncbi:histone-lysine N-methyltransferase ASHR3 [Arachis stenosperma]|uniref:histone-lysine N-methyltransferase ASHR3 n=1 Tax=Arachis stenosperma TaxID=217475 RepID=UPI0025ABD85C|nr:histone-lysine N-methyltransferase ASHR3 [Arachis stenosperma]
MPDLGNLSLSETLALPTPADPPVLTNSLHSANLKNLPPPSNTVVYTRYALRQDGIRIHKTHGTEIKVPAVKAANGDAKGLEDGIREFSQKRNKIGSEDPDLEFSLPFLVGASKMVECLVCHRLVCPGEELCCSVRGCGGIYHINCAKETMGISNPKKFKCSRHACFVCKQKKQLRCVRCTNAFHEKCAPWPEAVVSLQDNPGHAICWRHPSDWRLDGKLEGSTSDIQEVFRRLPVPYVNEDFKIDLTWKEMETKMEPPSYVHIRRNSYLVKKRSGEDDGAGCTSCSSTCSDDCVCRVQCISCSKSCRCSENCGNRPFRKEKKIKLVKTEHCGWGVEAAETINKGEFIIEYIGEVIDDALCEKRLWDMKYGGAQNFYMCEIRKDFTIDATFKGNMARFLNHGCDPNCVLEKWQVDGETRVGVFASRSIETGDPLTYDYRFVQFGPEVKCQCGAPNCRGFLGVKKKIVKLDICWGWGSKRKRTSAACPAIETHV